MLDRKYDPREVPQFYAKLKVFGNRDKRAALGFIATAARIAQTGNRIWPAGISWLISSFHLSVTLLFPPRTIDLDVQAAGKSDL